MNFIKIVLPAVLVFGSAHAAEVTLDLEWAAKIQSQVDSLKNTVDKDIRIPTGTIVAFYGNSAPKGWMLCDGSTIPSEFEELKKAVGNIVPDLRGMFLRGANNGRSDGKGDVERKIGEYQADGIGPHVHEIGKFQIQPSGASVGPHSPLVASSNKYTTEPAVNGISETRPRNIAINFIIKI